MERLIAVVPKLRAKVAGEVIQLLLDDDAVSGTLQTAKPTRWGSRRLFDRLPRTATTRLEPAILRRISKPRPTLADQISPADTRTSKLESAGRNASGKGSDSKCRSLNQELQGCRNLGRNVSRTAA